MDTSRIEQIPVVKRSASRRCTLHQRSPAHRTAGSATTSRVSCLLRHHGAKTGPPARMGWCTPGTGMTTWWLPPWVGRQSAGWYTTCARTRSGDPDRHPPAVVTRAPVGARGRGLRAALGPRETRRTAIGTAAPAGHHPADPDGGADPGAVVAGPVAPWWWQSCSAHPGATVRATACRIAQGPAGTGGEIRGSVSTAAARVD